jgi:hypothetical protein
MILRRLSYSICLGIVLTLISYLQPDRGGDLVLWPGLFVQVMVNTILLAIPTGDVFLSVPAESYVVFSFIIYTLAIFGVILVIGHFLDARRASRVVHGQQSS